LVLNDLFLLSFVYPTKERSKEKCTAANSPPLAAAPLRGGGAPPNYQCIKLLFRAQMTKNRQPSERVTIFCFWPLSEMKQASNQPVTTPV
jgi:hypothetical protein